MGSFCLTFAAAGITKEVGVEPRSGKVGIVSFGAEGTCASQLLESGPRCAWKSKEEKKKAAWVCGLHEMVNKLCRWSISFAVGSRKQKYTQAAKVLSWSAD